MSYPAIYQQSSDPHRIIKGSNKRDLKAQELLFGLIDLYIATSKPIGSQTLKQHGFAHLSSATIRNYFAILDKEGLLEQIHTSGGRIPTDLAWRRYFDTCTSAPHNLSTLALFEEKFQPFKEACHKNQPLYDTLNLLCESICQITKCACFLLTPSFEQDSLSHLKIWPLHVDRWAIITRSQMGFLSHEVVQIHHDTTSIDHLKIEKMLELRVRDPYFNLSHLEPKEQKIVQDIYSELMVRHLVRHTHPYERVWLKAGLSNLLNHPELSGASHLCAALGFFEHRRSKERLQQLMQHTQVTQAWIGQELHHLHLPTSECCLLASGFHIHQQLAGLVGIIGPKRVPYALLRHTLEHAGKLISHYLTRQYYSFKLTYEPDRCVSAPSLALGR